MMSDVSIGSNSIENLGNQMSMKNFLIDDEVEAKYLKRNQYFPCKIISKNHRNETYNVIYDDGLVEENVPIQNIRSVKDDSYFDSKIQPNNFSYSKVESKLKEGVTVQANFGNSSNFTQGVVVAVHSDDTYTIKCVKTNILKRIGSEKIQSYEMKRVTISNEGK
jgi:hypothetical protein